MSPEDEALFAKIVLDAPEQAAEVLAAAPQPESTPEPQLEPEVAAPEPEVKAAEPKVEEKPDPIAEALAKIAAMEAKYNARQPEPTAPSKPVFDAEEFLADPLTYMERHNISPDAVARAMVLKNAQRTGQAVSPDLQAYHYAEDVKRAALTKVDEVKQDLESVKASLARERFDLGVERAALDLSAFPALSSANKTDSAAFKELLAEEAAKLYSEGIKDPKQVLTKMEAQLARLQRVLAPASAPASSEGAKAALSSPKATSAGLRGAPTPKAKNELTPEEFQAQFFKEHSL